MPLHTYDGKPQDLLSLIQRLARSAHCESCGNDLGMWSLISKSEAKRTRPSSILISISCCALDSVTLLDVQSLLVRPRYVVDKETDRAPCGICSPASLSLGTAAALGEAEISPTMASLILRGSNTLQQKRYLGS